MADFRERSKSTLCVLALAALVAWFHLPFLLDQAIVVERDALAMFPIRAFLGRSLAAGEWPMWNPAPVLGKPFLAEWQSGLFYPPSALLAIPPVSRGYNLFCAFHYLWTTLGAFVLLRALGTTRSASMLGAAIWGFGGPLVSLGHLLNHLAAIAWLPWVLWAWLAPKTLARKLAASSAMLALPLLVGSPEMCVLIAAALVLASRHPLALLSLPLAAALTAVQLVPVWLYLGETYRGQHGLSAAAALSYSTTPARLLEMIGLGSSRSATAFLPSVHLGLLPLGLALLGLLTARRPIRAACALCAVALAALALGRHAALLPWLYERLPLVDLLRYPEKLLLGLHAMISVGAAFGLAWLGKRLPPRLANAVAALVLVLVTADLVRENRTLLYSLPSRAVMTPPPAARVMLSASSSRPNLPPIRYYANSTGWPATASPKEEVDLDRAVLFSSLGELWGLANLNTPASLNLAAHERLQKALGQAPLDRAVVVLAALGTDYLTSFVPLPSLERMKLSPSPGAPAHLYRLAEAEPHALVARHVAVAADAESALQRFVNADPKELPGLAVVEAPTTSPARHAGERLAGKDDVRWIRYAANRLELEAELAQPGILVVNDTHLRGWRATVDGREAPIERVNGLVRGVWLESGRHRVSMLYRPPGLIAGACVSALAVIAVLGLLGVTRRVPTAIGRWYGIPRPYSPAAPHPSATSLPSTETPRPAAP